MLKPKLNKIRIAVLIGCLFGLAIAQITTTFFHFETAWIKGTGPEDPLEAWSEDSYIFWQYNSTFYGCRNMSTLLVEAFSDNDTDILQYAINETTTWGGTVTVKAATYTGTYAAIVTLKDNVTLILQKGALNITVTIDSGADATLIDEENGYRQEWVAGSVYSLLDYRTGEFWYGGSNRTDLVANPTSTATIIVETDGTDTWMTNCSTGQRDAISTNVTQIWDWTIGNCSDGDSIFIKTGSYTINNSLTDGNKNNIRLELDVGAEIIAANNFNNRLLWLSSATGWRITGGEWNGNQANQGTPDGTKHVLIQMDLGCSNCTVEKANLHNCKQYGVWIWENSINCGVTDCSVYDVGWNGIFLGADNDNSSHLFAVNNRVWDCGDIGIDIQCDYSSAIGNHVWNLNSNKTDWLWSHVGIEIEGTTSSYCQISDNTIENTGGSGISVYGDHHIISHNTLNETCNDSDWLSALWTGGMNMSKISGNMIVASHANTAGIDFEGNNDNNTITDNLISATEVAIRFRVGSDYNWATINDLRNSGTGLSNSGTGNTINYNLGFVTENSGMVVNASATTWTITHGLASNATFVSCSFNSTEIDAWKWTSTSTTITVTCLNSATADAIRACYWYAIHKP